MILCKSPMTGLTSLSWVSATSEDDILSVVIAAEHFRTQPGRTAGLRKHRRPAGAAKSDQFGAPFDAVDFVLCPAATARVSFTQRSLADACLDQNIINVDLV